MRLPAVSMCRQAAVTRPPTAQTRRQAAPGSPSGSSGTVGSGTDAEPGSPADSPNQPQDTAPPEAAPSDQRVTLIGDSIGIDVTPYLKELYPKLNAEAKEGRQFYEAKSIIKQLIANDKLAPTVVFVLGSNGLIKESLLKEIIELIGSDRMIVFVNTQVPRSWCEGVNNTLTEIVAQYPNTIIADWYTASIGKDDYFYNDNVPSEPNRVQGHGAGDRRRDYHGADAIGRGDCRGGAPVLNKAQKVRCVLKHTGFVV